MPNEGKRLLDVQRRRTYFLQGAYPTKRRISKMSFRFNVLKYVPIENVLKVVPEISLEILEELSKSELDETTRAKISGYLRIAKKACESFSVFTDALQAIIDRDEAKFKDSIRKLTNWSYGRPTNYQ
jgi:hypothetical protein